MQMKRTLVNCKIPDETTQNADQRNKRARKCEERWRIRQASIHS